MAFMGYETPVEMPSMGVYNTDLMKMYIAGVKEQYDLAREEMKDFMKLYLDFYSPVNGATEAYQDLTLGGAGKLLNDMFARGIDPYKSPEARMLINNYISSRPTGLLKLLELQKLDYMKYLDAVRTAMSNGTYNPQMEDYYLNKSGLNDFQAITYDQNGNPKVNLWTRLAPSRFETLESITNPMFKDLDKTDWAGADPNHPGYGLYKVRDDILNGALLSGIKAVHDHPLGDYYVYLAEQKLKNLGIDRTTNPENFDALVEALLAKDVMNANAQAWQTKSEWDQWGAQQRQFAHAERMQLIEHDNKMAEKGYVYNKSLGGYVKLNGAGGDISISDRLIMSGTDSTIKKTGTADIAKGQSMLLSRYLDRTEKNPGNVLFSSDFSGKSAKSFMDESFFQNFTPNAAAKLASGKDVKGANIYYRPGRDAARINTYDEVANNILYGQLSRSPYTFGSALSVNSGDITKKLDKYYDEADPQKVQIIFNGGAYSVLENDGAYHTYTQATAMVYGNPDNNTKQRSVVRKFQIPYEITAPVNATTGVVLPSYNAEVPLLDHNTTKTLYGISTNTGNRTPQL